MTVARKIAWALVAAGAAIGTLSDHAPSQPPLAFGAYRVLAADLHVHPHPLSGSTLTPFDLVVEARRRGLDVLAITPHNGVLLGKLGLWFSRRTGGPTVIPGEEIHGPRYHMVALGIERYVDWRLSAADAIDAIHRQNGVAIAAHPSVDSWSAYQGGAEKRLDGAETLQPVAFWNDDTVAQLREFQQRAGAAPIGSSDYHGLGPLGICRTYVFASDDSASAVLDAIRAHRTVAYDGARAFGDPALVDFVRRNARIPGRPSPIGGALALIGLAVLVVSRR